MTSLNQPIPFTKGDDEASRSRVSGVASRDGVSLADSYSRDFEEEADAAEDDDF